MAVHPADLLGRGSTSPPPAIVVRDLEKTYRAKGKGKRKVRALRGVSFAVAPGTVFALLGPNGAGKSTTVKILTTLSSPDSGQAIVAGHDAVKEADRVRRAIGVVSQGSATDIEATGAENLILQGQLYGLGGRALRMRADELLERFDLADVAHRIVKTYSGGMRRKLDVALGLVHRPEVLFLDEPTTGLDPQARAEMWREIARLAGDEGLTVLLTTHYLDEADHLADQVAIIDRGCVVVEGTPDELKSELRGDAVQVELAETVTQERVQAATGRLDDALRELRLDGRTLRARVASGASALPPLLATLEEAGILVASATVSRPSLDDVYLRHTGHVFGEAAEIAHENEKELEGVR